MKNKKRVRRTKEQIEQDKVNDSLKKILSLANKLVGAISKTMKTK